MGKGKRNRKRRDDALTWPARSLAQANADVAAAERVLAEARRRAALAAGNGHKSASPEDQAEEFFTRPGDFYIAQFEIPQTATGGPIRAQCVFKADEAQRDYLVEVMRQVRGAFGENARISLSRAHQQQQRVVDHEPPPRYVPQPGMDDLRGVTAVHAAARQAARRRMTQQAEPSLWDVEQAAADMLTPDGQVPELTREQLQAQLPGMTRAEAAAELGVDPADIGGDIKHAETIEVEQLAAELGLSPLDLQPIEMRGGGRVYAVKPRQMPPPPGRHARTEPDSGDDSERDV